MAGIEQSKPNQGEGRKEESDTARYSYLNAEELFKDAKPTTIFEDVKRQYTLELEKGLGTPNDILLGMGYTQEEIDAAEPIEPEWKRQGRAWSELGSKVVGAEGD